MIRLRSNPYRPLEKQLGYSFRHRSLLETALMHRSYRFETEGVQTDNQRLEFLGDAALGLVAAAHFYEHHADLDEGGLTQLRTRVTCGKILAEVGARLGLGEFLKMGKGEVLSGGRQRPSVLTDAMEAVIGAAFIDGGLRAVQKIFRKHFTPDAEAGAVAEWRENPKGKLQEILQREVGGGPKYRVVAEEGPAHSRIYTVEVLIGDTSLGRGRGTNRKEAEARAALNALETVLQSGVPKPSKTPPASGG